MVAKFHKISVSVQKMALVKIYENKLGQMVWFYRWILCSFVLHLNFISDFQTSLFWHSRQFMFKWPPCSLQTNIVWDASKWARDICRCLCLLRKCWNLHNISNSLATLIGASDTSRVERLFRCTSDLECATLTPTNGTNNIQRLSSQKSWIYSPNFGFHEKDSVAFYQINQ